MKKESIINKNLIVICLFLYGYFWGFEKLGYVLTNHLFVVEGTVIAPVAKIVIYIVIICAMTCVMFPIIKQDIFSFKKKYLNESISIILLVSIIFIPFSFFWKNTIGIDNIPNMYMSEIEILVLVFSSLIYAPIVEELICRGALTNIFREYFNLDDNKILILTSAFFSLLHVVKMESWINKGYYFIIYLLLGGACGYLYKISNNICWAIITHFIWNLFTVIGMVVSILI